MPINYTCDECGHTADSMSGWYSVKTMLYFDDPNAPYPPGGLTQQGSLPDKIFEKEACRSKWLTDHGLSAAA